MFPLTEIADVPWFNGERVRFISERGACWFVAADLCRALGVGLDAAGVPNVTHALRFVPAEHRRLEKLETHPHLRPPYSKFTLVSLAALLMLCARKNDATPAVLAGDPMFVAWLASTMVRQGASQEAVADRARAAIAEAVRAIEAIAAKEPNEDSARLASDEPLRPAPARLAIFNETRLLDEPVFARYWDFRMLREAGRITAAARFLHPRARMTIHGATDGLLPLTQLDGARAIERAARAFDERVAPIKIVYETAQIGNNFVQSSRTVDYRLVATAETRRFHVVERIAFDSGRVVSLSQRFAAA